MLPQAPARAGKTVRRLPIALVALVLTLPLMEIGPPVATAQLPGMPVQDSLQQVYHAGAAGVPSTAVPDCVAPDDPPGCYGGEKLVLQAAGIGQTAMEPTIGVAGDGTAYMAGSTMVIDTPAVWGVAKTDARRSTDGGLTWTSVQPAIPVVGERLPPGNADPMIYVDPGTSRIFTFDLLGACQWLSYSDDKGVTWTHNPLACGAGDIPIDHQTIVAAKPRALPANPAYPNFLYYCTNRLSESACGRSEDGGTQWEDSGEPAYPEEHVCHGLHGHLEADPEGRIFLPSSQTCGVPWVAISEDAGQSWTQVQVSTMTSRIPHTSIASDSAGNLYYVWINDDNGVILPYLSTSTDHGRTWSAPRMIAPPGVRRANFPVVAGGDPGEVAISFPSTTKTGALSWDQTVVITEDALGADPIFLSATGNPPNDPIHRGNCTGRCGGLWDFIDIQISAAGEAWVATSDDCSGTCNSTPMASNLKAGDGIAIRQIGGPLLRTPPSGS
ncbi:MAG: sialidase family protein [Actinomycetota bacterium]